MSVPLYQQSLSVSRWVPPVVHELRSSLAGLSMALELATVRLQRAGFVSAFGDETRGLLQRTEQLLGDLTALAQPMRACLSTLALSPVLQRWAVQRHVQLAPSCGECWVQGDSKLLLHALDRLVQHARQDAPERPVRVQLRCAAHDTCCEVHLSYGVDAAAGPIDAEAFVPFVVGGTGHVRLDLPLAMAAVQAQGGQLTAAQEQNQQAFSLSLPSMARPNPQESPCD